jgi:hypothetical protein
MPASLCQEEDISTALLSPDPLLSDDDGSKTARKDIAPQKEEEELEEKENKIKKISKLENILLSRFTSFCSSLLLESQSRRPSNTSAVIF